MKKILDPPPSMNISQEQIQSSDPTPITLNQKLSQSQQISPILIVIFVALCGVLFSLIFYFDQISHLPWLPGLVITTPKRSKQPVQRVIVPSPPAAPSYLPPGKQTYTIGQSADVKGPHINSLILDPLDAHINQPQTLTVAFQTSTVSKASITIFTDTGSYPLPLTNTSGSWSATWTLLDSVNKRYIVVIKATDPTGTNQVIIAPRTSGPIKTDTLLSP